MKNIIYILLFISICYKAAAQDITYIPDPYFEQVLIDLGIDSDGVVNGQILTSDALSVTELDIAYSVGGYPYSIISEYECSHPDSNMFYSGYICDITGLEAFVNLEKLILNGTLIEELNLNTLTELKYLYCNDNMLKSLDLSANIKLEYLQAESFGDVLPINSLMHIDLSNNPNIKVIRASGVKKINLKNGNNNADMSINITCGYFCYGSDSPPPHTCIEVDDLEAAINSQYPYSEWNVYHSDTTYSYVDDLEQCSLAVNSFEGNKISVYPNPVSDVLYFDTTQEINKVILFDVLGRTILEQDNGNSISVIGLQKGNYILKMFTNSGTYTEKIVVE